MLPIRDNRSGQDRHRVFKNIAEIVGIDDTAAVFFLMVSSDTISKCTNPINSAEQVEYTAEKGYCQIISVVLY